MKNTYHDNPRQLVAEALEAGWDPERVISRCDHYRSQFSFGTHRWSMWNVALQDARKAAGRPLNTRA